MFSSYIGSYMNMKADIYTLQSQQTDSGVFARKWVYSKTIDCRAEYQEIQTRWKSNRRNS
jgi:hypothetical protein